MNANYSTVHVPTNVYDGGKYKPIRSNFNIHLIPETLKVTNLSLLEKKQFVNIELDQNTVSIVDTVERVLSR